MLHEYDKNAMQVELDAEVNYVIRPAETRQVSHITIDRMVDFPSRRTVSVFTHQVGELVLWEGDAYDEIGQWTDTDVMNRIKELLAS